MCRLSFRTFIIQIFFQNLQRKKVIKKKLFLICSFFGLLFFIIPLIFNILTSYMKHDQIRSFTFLINKEMYNSLHTDTRDLTLFTFRVKKCASVSKCTYSLIISWVFIILISNFQILQILIISFSKILLLNGF